MIDRWLDEKLPKVKLPGPVALVKDPKILEALHLPVAEQIRQSLAVHDGTGEFALIPMSSDANYCLLSYVDATSAKKMMQEVCESEFWRSKDLSRNAPGFLDFSKTLV